MKDKIIQGNDITLRPQRSHRVHQVLIDINIFQYLQHQQLTGRRQPLMIEDETAGQVHKGLIAANNPRQA